MKQTRWLSEFSCLSEYTRLYPISQDGPGLCFCLEFGVSAWKSHLDRVNPVECSKFRERTGYNPGLAGSEFGRFSEVQTCRTRVRSSPFTELRIQTPNQGSTIFFLRTPNLQSKGSSRSFLRTPNQNSELRVKTQSWTKPVSLARSRRTCTAASNTET